METVNAFINPWTSSESKLVSLVSGVVASEKSEHDLVNVTSVGEAQLQEFVSQRMSSEPTKDFYAPLKQNKLSTFCLLQKRVTGTQAKAKVQEQDRSLFTRLLIVSRSREVDLQEVLSYPLSKISLPLAAADGSMAKTNKAMLLDAIEKDCVDYVVEKHTSSETAIIIDAMALLQSMPVASIPTTFKLLGGVILKAMVALARRYRAQRVDFVIDEYRQKSIKNAERSRRAGVTGSQTATIQISNGDVKIPGKWKAFLASPTNKTSLLDYLHTYLSTATSEYSFCLFSTTVRQCFKISYAANSTSMEEIPELHSNHEEADTRLLLHALHANERGSSVIISSPDTDVAILSIAHSNKFSALTLLTGSKDRRRLIDIKTVANQLGEGVVSSLIGLHALTGCDSVSSFNGKGKKTAYQLLKKSASARAAMQQLGSDLNISSDTLAACETFTCLLYGDSGSEINHCRYRIFCTKAVSSFSLPPCQSSLHQHIRRANYVANTWKSATVALTNTSKPEENGWLSDGALYKLLWHTCEVAPTKVLKMISCSCASSECQGRCSCRQAKLPCTGLCRCLNCTNKPADDKEGDTTDGDSDEETD